MVQGDAVMAAVPALIAVASKQGEVHDADMQREVGAALNFAAWQQRCSQRGKGKRKGRALQDQVENRLRALWLSHEHVSHRREHARMAKTMAAAEKGKASAIRRAAAAERKRKKEDSVKAMLRQDAEQKQKREDGAAAAADESAKRSRAERSLQA